MKNALLPLFLCLCTVALFISDCTLDTEPEIPTGVNNIEAPVFLSAEIFPDNHNIFQGKAWLGSRGNLNILHHGWVWSETPGPTLLNGHFDAGRLTPDSFTTEITGLVAGKVYYLRPFVSTACDTIYGPEQCSFLGANIIINTDTVIFKGADVQFSNIPIDNCSYLWDFGDGDASTEAAPKHTFDKDTGTVMVQLTADVGGCKVMKAMTLKIVSDPFAGYWVPIPGGAFTMGCTDEPFCNSDEVPAHPVSLNKFFIGKTEITQGQWKAVLNENPSYFDQCGQDCPVERVSWNDIHDKFIPALYLKTGRMHRLPSEAEWEYAAHGGATAPGMTKYAGSDNLDLVGWYDGNSDLQPHPVAQKMPNGYGLFDMSGNVQEWVEDNYHFDYEGAPDNGSAWTDVPPGAERVLRGGSWIYSSGFCRVVFRLHNSQPFQARFLGFRLARPY